MAIFAEFLPDDDPPKPEVDDLLDTAAAIHDLFQARWRKEVDALGEPKTLNQTLAELLPIPKDPSDSNQRQR